MPDAYMTITGNVADVPELKFSQAGKAWAQLTVILNERREQSPGNWVEVAKNGMRVVAFGDLAEHAAESVQKGDRVTVAGRLVPQQWEDRETSQARYGWQLQADDVALSLRWATGRVQKARRGGNGGDAGPWAGGGSQGGYDAPPF